LQANDWAHLRVEIGKLNASKPFTSLSVTGWNDQAAWEGK
jgi:hypothetical protein